MKKKNLKKLLLAVCCAALLVCVSIGATVAYLTSKDTVTNTFTVGKVAITLDEAKVNLDGTEVANADRVTTNDYKLMPGHDYKKDPTVHVEANSENSWIFVKVVNDISAFEAAQSDTYDTITKQITITNGWTQLKDADNNDVAGVYYKEYTQSAKVENLKVFEEFKIADNAESSDNWNTVGTDPKNPTQIIVTAYAIQRDGFDTPIAAWDVVSK